VKVDSVQYTAALSKMDVNSLLDQLPALEPPPGVIPNFVDPPDNNNTRGLVIALYFMIALATIGFAARMFTKIYVMKQFQPEDCK
jgi:hypothetical protein